MTFREHRVNWTGQKVQRFWDHLSRNPTAGELYFSKMVGESLLRHVRRSGVALQGRVLDFGCGPGHLMDVLLRQGIACEGVDFSSESVTAAKQRFEPYETVKNVRQVEMLPTPLAPQSYDLVFFLETIEHLLDDDLQATLAELNRITASGGHVVVTTPNAEDLAAAEVMCPDCGAVFHSIQHLRSWNPETLASAMNRHGFRTIRCRPVYFTQKTWASRLKAAGYRALRYKLPHLMFIGRKTE